MRSNCKNKYNVDFKFGYKLILKKKKRTQKKQIQKFNSVMSNNICQHLYTSIFLTSCSYRLRSWLTLRLRFSFCAYVVSADCGVRVLAKQRACKFRQFCFKFIIIYYFSLFYFIFHFI